MVIKYYGYGQHGTYKGWDDTDAMINLLFTTPAHKLCDHTHGTPSLCVWLVPGTFDLEGRHVG